MQSPWKFVFIEIARLSPGTCAYWTMKSGAEFYMKIPETDDIMDDRFSETVEFPFTFADIKSLKVRPLVSARDHSISNDIESVKAITAHIDGLGCEVNTEEVVIRDMTT